MPEYIEREVVVEFIRSYRCSTDVAIHMEQHLNEIPAADVRPVVLCRDCKHRFNYPICAYRGDDWFCGYGEKREES